MNWQTVLIIGSLTFCISTAQEKTYYVLSNDSPEVKCPVEKCQNLTELLDTIVPGYISNIVIFLSPGIHRVSSNTSKIISITSASNFTIRSINSSTRATIKCDGNISFEFHSCLNLTIRDITFETCGALRHFNSHHIPVSNFSVYVSHSLGVYIINTHILNGTGIGLVVENVKHQFLILDSVISYCGCNLYLVNYDNYTSNTTTASSIVINNSSFHNARKIYPSQVVYSSGIFVLLYQSKFLTTLILKNVNMVENEMTNLFAKFNLCNKMNSLKIYNLKSIKLSRAQNLYFELMYSIKCNKGKQINFIVNSTEIIGGETRIRGVGKKRELVTNQWIIVNNTNVSNCLFTIKRVKTALFYNVVIQNTESSNSMHIEYCVVLFTGYFLYQRNIGSQLTFKKSHITVEKNSSLVFSYNSHLLESPLHCIESNITMMSGSSMHFNNNSGYECGGITLLNSMITFEGNASMMFIHNTGKRGGAMAFYALSQLMPINGQATLTFMYNHASIVGGAIYVQDYDYIFRHIPYKFIQVLKTGIKPPHFNFVNNSAIQAGSMLYGGTSDKEDFSFDNSNKNDLSMGATTPFKVCKCTNLVPNCNHYKEYYYPIPGQPFKIDVVAVGQWNGVVPANIQIKFNETSNAIVKANEYIQTVGRNCTTLTYTFMFMKQYEIVSMQVITTDRNPVTEKNLKLLLLFKNCTLGFTFANESNTCVCNKVLTDHNIECDIETLTIKRQSPKWINATFDHLLSSDQSGVIVHDHCPYDYCEVFINRAIQSLNLNHPDKQCVFNRSGILCGGCQTNFSQVLGTSKCKMCTNAGFPLIVFLIALAGIALVVCLMLLNITVTVGTINGLIFYANILKANDAFFFPQLASDSFFSTFIAWLNLDLGIETCLYDALDAYVKTWLQFLFPLYIWLIVIVIIAVSHHSTKASKLMGNNSVHVLATLFLLSYAKLLRAIITIFSSTQLTYPDGYVRTVWLYDGNVEFLRGKHIPLFQVALFFLIIVSVPFTATLTCIQCLQKISHYKLLLWVVKLQPLFDAYTGPYKIKHRYWTGLLLFIRVCLYLVFSLNIFGDPIINLLTIAVCMFTLFAYLSIIGGVYKLWWLNVIETAFIMNVGLLSTAGLYNVAAGVAITPITYTSTSFAFILFVSITLFHITAKVSRMKYGQVLIANIKKLYNNCWLRNSELESVVENITEESSENTESLVTYSEVELREPLLTAH